MKSRNERWDMFLAAALTGVVANPEVERCLHTKEKIMDAAVDFANLAERASDNHRGKNPTES